jgi:hypothetical protein
METIKEWVPIIKAARDAVWLLSILVAIIMWVLTSISASAERVEKGMRLYVDERHESVEKRLDSMESVLEKIDNRTIDIIKEVRNK